MHVDKPEERVKTVKVTLKRLAMPSLNKQIVPSELEEIAILSLMAINCFKVIKMSCKAPITKALFSVNV